VIVLLDEIVGHMREKMRPLTPEELEVYDRRSPSLSPKEYLHYGPGTNFLGPIASFGEGYRFHVTGLTHDETGFPTNDPEQIAAKMERLRQKIENNRRALQDVVEESMEDAEVALFAYGAVARSAKYALREARQRGVRVGLFRPRVIWPFPEEAVRGMLERVKRVIVPEMNQGQMVLEVERVNQGRTEVVSVQRVDGEIIDPREILARIPGL
jgi:2-oxoglutarate ferredoxin oxidoreductase subunit alpha